MSSQKTDLGPVNMEDSGRFFREKNRKPAQPFLGVVQADTGLGTTYERWALNRYLTRLHKELGFSTALEAPDDGMTGISGINSLILGLSSVEVSVLLADHDRAAFARRVWEHHAPQAVVRILDQWDGKRLPFEDGQFELVWNFNVMTRQADPVTLLQEMARVSSRFVLIGVPNRANYAFWLHRLHHRVAKEVWDHGRIEWMEPGPWQAMLSRAGLSVQHIEWIDCPWWPDIVDPAQLLRDFVPFLKSISGLARPENRGRWFYQELPYYQPERFAAVHQKMARLSFFEDTPLIPLKRRFAHHFAVLARKG